MRPEVIAFIVVLVVYFLGMELLKRYADAHLQALYVAGRYDECVDYLDRWLMRILFTTYKQYFLRFTFYEAKGDKFAAGRMLDHLLGMRLSKSQRSGLVVRAFNFYVRGGEKKRARALLDEISAGDARVAADCKLTYDVVFEHDCTHLRQMEKLLAQATDDAQKEKLLFLLSKQYYTQNMRAKAKECERKIQEIHSSATIGARKG